MLATLATCFRSMRAAVVITVLGLAFAARIKDSADVPCGSPAVTPLTVRIFGGTIAIPGSWPWVALIADNFQYMVGAGTILHPHVILTSAQFFEGEDFEFGIHDLRYWKLYTGEYNISTADPYQKVHRIRRVVIHPAYNYTTLDNDVALILTKKPIIYNQHTRPACLPDFKHSYKTGQVCYQAGWGTTALKGGEQIMLQADVPILVDHVCGSTWRDYLPQSEICAGYIENPKQFCPDDIGGALMCRFSRDGPWYLQGIASSGGNCMKSLVPGIYKDGLMYEEWIRATMADAGYPCQY